MNGFKVLQDSALISGTKNDAVQREIVASLPVTTMSSSNFANSHNVVYDNTFVTAGNYHVHNSRPSRSDHRFNSTQNPLSVPRSDRLMHTHVTVLCENIAGEAIYDSDERCDAPKVHPETRKAVQQDILGWITHGDDDPEPKKILWVSGPAGAGKTAIAGSIAEYCDEEGLLAASFFFSSFSSSEKRRSKRCVVATLVYSLLQHDGLQALRESILSIIERDPAIFRTTLRKQCKALLLKPFHDSLGKLDVSALPRVIILDGLDEVEAAGSRQLDKHEARLANEADQVEILSALLQAAHDINFPFRIVVLSRPERVIRDFFSTRANHVSREIFLDDKYNPDSDILLFLNASFADIRRRYRLPPHWPAESDIKRLVDNASGQFIYPVTIIRFLQSGKHPNPQALLRIILDTSQDSSLNALAPLDALYTRILMSSPDPPLAVRWIGAIDQYLDRESARFTRQLLQDFEGQAEYLLENLTSLVYIPPAGDGVSSYEFYHRSLLDFLDSVQRCGPALEASYTAGSEFYFDRLRDVLRSEFSDMVPSGLCPCD